MKRIEMDPFFPFNSLHVIRSLFMAASLYVISQTAASATDFDQFFATFLSPDGRIVDTGNGNISHSEGQGYGLVFAEANADAKTFALIWNWTQKNLQIRNDALLAWRWEPRGSRGIVTDMNNATDGDILVAWALFLAADRWKNESYRTEAQKILASVRQLTLVPSSFGPLILPAVKGFQRPSGVVVNPSYWVFPAFPVFAKEDSATDWMAVSQAGQKLIKAGTFGRWHLPPDWLLVQESKLSLPDGFPPDFGYNAIRVPLHLIWDQQTNEEWFTGYRAYRATFPSLDEVKAPVNLANDAPGPNLLLPGMAKIYQLIGVQGPAVSGYVPTPTNPAISAQPYFSAALSLLSDLAFRASAQPGPNFSKESR